MDDEVIWGTKDFQVPEYFNYADIIDEWAQKEKEGKKQSDTPALWWIDGEGNEVKWSFQDVASNSKKTANVLSTAADIKPGDRVMVILPAIPEYWLIQAACLRTGGVLIVVPDNIGPNELHRRILKSRPACVVSANSDQINTELLDVIDKWQNARPNKEAVNEEVEFHVERDKIQSLDTNIVNMTAESLNFWLTTFVEGVCKEDGERNAEFTVCWSVL